MHNLHDLADAVRLIGERPYGGSLRNVYRLSGDLVTESFKISDRGRKRGVIDVAEENSFAGALPTRDGLANPAGADYHEYVCHPVWVRGARTLNELPPDSSI